MFCKEPEDPENDLKARMITSFTEDPATGSANGCLTGYLVKHKYFGDSKIDVKVEQGAEVNRPSILYLKGDDMGSEISVEVGGKVAVGDKGQPACRLSLAQDVAQICPQVRPGALVQPGAQGIVKQDTLVAVAPVLARTKFPLFGDKEGQVYLAHPEFIE